MLSPQIRSKMIKYIVLIGGLWAACDNRAIAQQSPATVQEVVVTRSGFSHKVAEFGKAAGQNEPARAETIFADINKMANAEFGASRDKMRNAANEADRAKYRELTMSQRKLFAEALKLKQQDMMANRKAIVEKLEQFAETIQ